MNPSSWAVLSTLPVACSHALLTCKSGVENHVLHGNGSDLEHHLSPDSVQEIEALEHMFMCIPLHDFGSGFMNSTLSPPGFIDISFLGIIVMRIAGFALGPGVVGSCTCLRTRTVGDSGATSRSSVSAPQSHPRLWLVVLLCLVPVKVPSWLSCTSSTKIPRLLACSFPCDGPVPNLTSTICLMEHLPFSNVCAKPTHVANSH